MLHEIARTLQEHVAHWPRSNPEGVRLNEFMTGWQLVGEQVHCSDFSLSLVTAKKHEWIFDIIYRPHLDGQPKAMRARVTVYPFSNVNDPSVEFSSDATAAYFVRSPWSRDDAWDGQFRVRQRERKIISIAALVALPVGLISGLIFAVWLARLRRHARRKGAPSLRFMFTLGSTLFVLVLGVFATPATSPLHWALVAFFLPSAVVVSTGIVNLIFDCARERVLDAISAGVEQEAESASSWHVGNRSADDAASGYRMSWSTYRCDSQP